MYKEKTIWNLDMLLVEAQMNLCNVALRIGINTRLIFLLTSDTDNVGIDRYDTNTLVI